MSDEVDLVAVAVAVARVEGKLDAYASRTVATEEKLAELDARLRATAPATQVAELDSRLRTQEARPLVTPTGLLAALVGTVTVAGGFVGLLDYLN